MPAALDARGLLELLVRHEVEFIVVGGVAAVLQGAPITTMDLDIVHRRSEANVGRLLAALDELEASYRLRPDLKPDAKALSGPGHHLLHTGRGPLDILGQVVGELGHDELSGRAEQLDVATTPVMVLELDFLIELKLRLGRTKDKLALPILRALLEERRSG